MTVINQLRLMHKGRSSRTMFSSVTTSTVIQLDHSPGHIFISWEFSGLQDQQALVTKLAAIGFDEE